MDLFRIGMLAQDDFGGDAGAAAGGAAAFVILLIQLAVVVLIVAGLWKMFAKAGKPGWAAIVPIYNMIVMLEIIGRPLWWIL
ncbi:MAG: signal peptidase I, partial [Planctomyces sp.]|nr:signal peptidase I [Planctomyces sp.]